MTAPSRTGAVKSLTIAIASYQRRDALVRLLESLASELATADTRGSIDVVVVLDGSTDGSAAAARAVALPVPVRVLEEPHRGLAATRNAGWRDAAARGSDLVLFLDDDLVVSEGWLAAHRAAHAATVPRVCFGPCAIPDDWDVASVIRDFWADRYRELAADPVVTRFDRFSGANTSVPVALLAAVDGYDERFVGYGLEDYELAVRWLAARVEITFVADAVAWHLPARTPAALCRDRYDEGRNVVRFARLHPDRVGPLLPTGPAPRPAQLLRRLRCASPRTLRAAATGLALAARTVAPVDARRAERCLAAAAGTAYYAGLRAEDRRGAVIARDLSIAPGLACAR